MPPPPPMSRTNQAPIVVVKAARCFGPTTRSSAALARTDSARRLLRDLSHWLRLLLTCYNTNGRASGPAKRMNCSDSICSLGLVHPSVQVNEETYALLLGLATGVRCPLGFGSFFAFDLFPSVRSGW